MIGYLRELMESDDRSMGTDICLGLLFAGIVLGVLAALASLAWVVERIF